MANVNQDIYPTIDEVPGIIRWSKELTGANFAEYAGGLEKSVTFSSSANPNAPLRNYCTAFSSYNRNFDDYTKTVRYANAPNNQRIILTKSTNASNNTTFVPRNGSDSLGTKLLYDNPFDSSFNNSTHQIVTGINWQGLCGRLVIFYSLTPPNDPLTTNGEHDVGNTTYVTTWKNFVNYAPSLSSDNRSIVVWGVYITDIWAGSSSGNPVRQYAITPVNLNPAIAAKFTDPEVSTEFSALCYGAYRASRSYPYPHSLTTSVNGVITTGTMQSNQTNWLPVFGGAFAAAGSNAGGQSGYGLASSGGYLHAGALQGEAPQHLFTAIDGNSGTISHFAAVAMIVTGGNFASFKQAMEERASSYGIILLTHALTSNAVRSKDLSSLARATDVIIPLINNEGIIGGFTEDGEEAISNPPTASVIAGGLDGVFTYGVPIDDPTDTDPNRYVDSIELSEPNLTAIDAFNRTFAINKNGLDAFANFLWNANDTKFQEIVDGLKLFGENPIEGVINMILFPFDVAAKAGGSLQEIKIGRTATGVEGYRLSERAPAVIELGSAEFIAAFKDTAPFLDFEPYTQAELYIPFIGKIPISTAQFVGHTVNVKMIVDYITGACVAVVYCDHIPVIYKQGVIGVQIPITATNSAQFAETMIGGIIGTAGGIGDTAAKAATGDIGGALMSGAQTAFNAYQTAATPVMYEGAGASSPSCAIFQPLKPYFVMYRPVPKEVNIYGHAVGYATQRTVTVGSCSGFSVFGNVDVTGIGATAEEKAAIKTLLEGGIYI